MAGGTVDLKALRQSDVPGTLITGLGGPQPPAALSTAVIGMKKGGKVQLVHFGVLHFGVVHI